MTVCVCVCLYQMKGHSDDVEIVSLVKQSMTALSPADTHWNSIQMSYYLGNLVVILRVSSDDVVVPDDLDTSCLVHHETWGLAVVVELEENLSYHLDDNKKKILELVIVTGRTLRMSFVTKSCPCDYLRW